jgi:hypothetical protein
MMCEKRSTFSVTLVRSEERRLPVSTYPGLEARQAEFVLTNSLSEVLAASLEATGGQKGIIFKADVAGNEGHDG